MVAVSVIAVTALTPEQIKPVPDFAPGLVAMTPGVLDKRMLVLADYND